MARFERRGFGRPRGRPSFGRGYGYGRGFERDEEPKPVKVGEEYDVEIKEVGSKGDGIARVKNFVVFVPDTKEGEKCRIKVTEVKNRFAVGEKVGGAAAEEAAALEEPEEAEETEEAAEAEEVEEEVKEEPEEPEELEEAEEEESLGEGEE